MAVTAAFTATGIKSDRWLSKLLGRPAWNVDASILGATEAIAKAGAGPLFLSTRVDAGDVVTLNRFEDAGFRVVDLTVTLESPTAPIRIQIPHNVRFAQASDEAAVRSIAGTSFELSRLHLDPLVPKAVADKSRAEWATNFFAGLRGDAMVVAEHNGAVAAFLLLIVPADGVMTIDLIAAGPGSRKIGLGSACIQFAALNFERHEKIRVGTQAANIKSLRFYARLGFQPCASQYVLHYHRI